MDLKVPKKESKNIQQSILSLKVREGDKCHGCSKSNDQNEQFTCQSDNCQIRFCLNCYRKYQIDSFTKQDFKHVIENGIACPVCLQICICHHCQEIRKDLKLSQRNTRNNQRIKDQELSESEEISVGSKRQREVQQISVKRQRTGSDIIDSDEMKLVSDTLFRLKNSFRSSKDLSKLYSTPLQRKGQKYKRREIQKPEKQVQLQTFEEDSSGSIFNYDDVADYLKDEGEGTPPYPDVAVWEYDENDYRYLKPVETDKNTMKCKVGGLTAAKNRQIARKEKGLTKQKFENVFFEVIQTSQTKRKHQLKKGRGKRGPYKKKNQLEEEKVPQNEQEQELSKDISQKENSQNINNQMNQVEEEPIVKVEEPQIIEESLPIHNVYPDLIPARVKGTNLLVFIKRNQAESLGQIFDIIDPTFPKTLEEQVNTDEKKQDLVNSIVRNIKNEYKMEGVIGQLQDPEGFLHIMKTCFDKFFGELCNMKVGVKSEH